MKDLTKRLKALEQAIESKEIRKREHDPFILYRPWSFVLDEHYVFYYPEGLFRKPQKMGPMTFASFCELLKEYPGHMRVQISLGMCTEWLFAFHIFSEHSRLYTSEQLEEFKNRDLQDNPELAYMLTEDGAEILKMMLRLPQTCMTNTEILQKAIKEAS